jgi:hypothetical protein
MRGNPPATSSAGHHPLTRLALRHSKASSRTRAIAQTSRMSSLMFSFPMNRYPSSKWSARSSATASDFRPNMAAAVSKSPSHINRSKTMRALAAVPISRKPSALLWKRTTSCVWRAVFSAPKPRSADVPCMRFAGSIILSVRKAYQLKNGQKNKPASVRFSNQPISRKIEPTLKRNQEMKLETASKRLTPDLIKS